MLTTLRVPKLVELKNPRLLILFYVLQTGCVAFLVSWFITAKFWESSDPIGGLVHGTMWVEGRDDTSAVEERLADLSASTCKQLKGYEYWWDAGGRYRWQNISCIAPCKKGQKQGCVGLAESFKMKGEGEVFIPTHQKILQFEGDWHDEGEDSFLLSAEALTLVLSYHYDLPPFTWDGNPRIPSFPSGRHSASSMQSITTILVDANGNTRTIPPGQEIAFTVPQLLEFSGSKDALNDLHATAGTNQHPDSAGEPPLTWLSGLELEVSIECTGSEGETLTCYLGVRQTERGWTYERTVESRDGEHEVRVQHGLRVFMKGGGMRRHFHLATLVSKLTSSWVLLLLPRRVVFFIAIFFLGHLSTIYRQATIDTFQMKDYLAGMSARLMVWNAAFVELQDTSLPNGAPGISKRRLHERLRAVLSLRGDVLDQGEVKHLVTCCHRALISCGGGDPSALGIFSSLKDMKQEIEASQRAGTPDARDLYEFIDSDRFSVACTSFEKINLDAVVRLFDQQRRRWLLERLFTPNDLRKYTLAVQAPQEDDARSASSLGVNISGEDASEESGGGDSSEICDSPDERVLTESRRGTEALTLEEEMARQRELNRTVVRLVKEHKSFHERHEAHSRELEESHLALQRIHRESTEYTMAIKELKHEVDGRHESIRLAVQAANEKLRGSIGDHEESMGELWRAMDEKCASLEGRHDMLHELYGAVDALQRSLAQRVERVEALLDPGTRPRAGQDGGLGGLEAKTLPREMAAGPAPPRPQARQGGGLSGPEAAVDSRAATAAPALPPQARQDGGLGAPEAAVDPRRAAPGPAPPPPQSFFRTLRPSSAGRAAWALNDVTPPNTSDGGAQV